MSPVRKWRYENDPGTKTDGTKTSRYENGGTKTACRESGRSGREWKTAAERHGRAEKEGGAATEEETAPAEGQLDEATNGQGPDNQTLLRLLEQGEKLHSMFRCARVQGLDIMEGLLLFGKDHFYVSFVVVLFSSLLPLPNSAQTPNSERTFAEEYAASTTAAGGEGKNRCVKQSLELLTNILLNDLLHGLQRTHSQQAEPFVHRAGQRLSRPFHGQQNVLSKLGLGLFYAALVHLVFMLSDRPQFDLQDRRNRELERGTAQVSICAQSVWGILWQHKKAVLEEWLKKGNLDLDLFTSRAKCGEAANRAWLQFVDSQTVGAFSQRFVRCASAERTENVADATADEAGPSGAECLRKLRKSTAMSSFTNTSVDDVESKQGLDALAHFDDARLRVEPETFYMWIRVHISLVRELIRNRCQRYHEWHSHVRKWSIQEWHNAETELIRERGLWGPDHGSVLGKFQLDITEGPCRIRRKLVPNRDFYRHYPYRPYLEGPNAKPLRAKGLDIMEGLLLFGKDHFYVVDGFTLLKTREIRDLDFLPEQFHDPIIPYIAMGCRSRPLSTKVNRQCNKFAYDDIKEVHKRRYLLQQIALEVFSTDGRNFLLAFPRKVRDHVFQKLVSMAKNASSDVAQFMNEQKKLRRAEMREHLFLRRQRIQQHHHSFRLAKSPVPTKRKLC
ncbi:hypothetical protein niasHT_020761 [Heterodera trifolii]|uniref:BEACH-type PH domain-containing protein n=1 Tax=Heterodera trifolii TaxID=157864 RepID=A0ABD2KF65_9BILA